jgi:hypothetical protein
MSRGLSARSRPRISPYRAGDIPAASGDAPVRPAAQGDHAGSGLHPRSAPGRPGRGQRALARARPPSIETLAPVIHPALSSSR